MRRNAAAGDVERGAVRAKAGDDDAAARRSEGARVWRRCVMVVVFSGRAPRGGRRPVEWSGAGALELQQASNQGGGEAADRRLERRLQCSAWEDGEGV